MSGHDSCGLGSESKRVIFLHGSETQGGLDMIYMIPNL